MTYLTSAHRTLDNVILATEMVIALPGMTELSLGYRNSPNKTTFGKYECFPTMRKAIRIKNIATYIYVVSLTTINMCLSFSTM